MLEPDWKGSKGIMIIKNVLIFREEKEFLPGTVTVQDGIIQDVFLDGLSEGSVLFSGENVVDGQGCYMIPGLIDMHFHGCRGRDICDGTREALCEIARYQASVGVTGIAPATMTLPVQELENILATIFQYAQGQKIQKNPWEADYLGINMEGPFISKVKKGAQNGDHIIPCAEEVYQRFQKAAGGLVKYIGIAPEEEGAMEFIEAISKEVKVSLAHTNADYKTAQKAFNRGACHVVHLFNAMPVFDHREPGVVGAVADSPWVTAELICDGVHIHPAAVRAAFRMLGEERIIFISDSMRAAGMPDGKYTLGGLEVDVHENRAVLASDKALAGSVKNLYDCMKIAVLQMEIPLAQAVACATVNPAKSLSVYGEYGSIDKGKRADLILIGENMERRAVMKDGVWICQ